MFLSLLWLIMDNTLRIGTGIPYGRDRRFVMPAITGMVFSVAGVVLGVILHTQSWILLWPLDQVRLQFLIPRHSINRVKDRVAWILCVLVVKGVLHSF